MIRSGGRYYVVDGKRMTEKEYTELQKQQKKPVKKQPVKQPEEND